MKNFSTIIGHKRFRMELYTVQRMLAMFNPHYYIVVNTSGRYC